MKIIQPLVEFQSSADIENVHREIAPNVDLASLNLQFLEICNSDVADVVTGASLSDVIAIILKSKSGIEHYNELVTVLCRINACTPHSADVERCISANNLLKTSLRSSLTLKTECNYLQIRFNLPPLDK